MIDDESQHDVKQLVRAENWILLGRLFNFTPKFCEFRGERYFNWQSAPPSLHRALGWKFPVSFPPSDNPEPVIKKVPATNGHKTKTKYVRKKSIRCTIWEWQDGRCFFCGCKVGELGRWTLDHLHPKSRGGSEDISNKRGACYNCNNAKANMTLAEFLDTDYLPEERRKLLGATAPPTVKFGDAKDQQDSRHKQENAYAR